MKISLPRKGLALGLAMILATTVAACSSETEAGAVGTEEITFSVWDTGLTGAIPKALAGDKTIQEQYDIKVSVRSTPNLPEVYSNLLTEKGNANIGAPESFASMNEKGGKIKISGLVAPNTTSIIGKANGDPAEALRGKRLAAVTSSGGWNVLAAAIERKYGLKDGKDYEVITVPNTLTGAAQIAAGTADFVMGWEPSVSQTLTKYDDMKILASASDLGINESKQFVLGVSSGVSDETVGRLVEALNATVEKMKGDAGFADKYGAEQGYTDDTVSRVLESGALPVKAAGLDDGSRESMLSDLKLIYESGGLQKEPTPSIFR